MLMDPSIESLDLSGKGFRQLDVSMAESNQKILSLKLDNNHVTSLQGIHQYPNLLQLSARANRISDTSPLHQLIQLVIVNVQNNAISVIQGIDDLRCLQWISLAGNTIKDASGIEKCVYLTHLDLSDNFIRIIPNLSKLTLLKTLLLHGNGIKSLSSSLLPPSLHTLTLAENSLTDLNEFSVLQSIKSLRQLSLMGNPCTSGTTPDGRLTDYRLFILYWRPSLSVIDGVTTTDIERHQARMLFFGHQRCPFTIGDHNILIQHLSSTSFNKPFTNLSGYSQNNENTSPNPSPTKGPRILKPFQDPVIKRSPLSPRRSVDSSTTGRPSTTIGCPSTTTGCSTTIIDTLNSLKEVQQMIKEEEQYLLDQSIATATTNANETVTHVDQVGVVLAYGMVVEDIDDQTLSGSIPESRKGFSNSSTSERGVVRIGPRLRYSPAPMNTTEEETNTSREEENDESLATSMAKAYGLPLSESTALTQGLSRTTEEPSLDQEGTATDIGSNTVDSVQFHPMASETRSNTVDSVQFHPLASETRSNTVDSVQFHPMVTVQNPDNETQVESTEENVSHPPSPDDHSPNYMIDNSLVPSLELGVLNSERSHESRFDHTPKSDYTDQPSTTIPCSQPDHTHFSLAATDHTHFSPAATDHTHFSAEATDHTLFYPINTRTANLLIQSSQFVTDHIQSQMGGASVKADAAALIIQSIWRGYKCRQEQWLKRHKAARLIQATWRGYYCRVYNHTVGNVYKEMRRKKVESYITLLCIQLQGCREELAHQISTVQIQEEALQSLLSEVEELRNESKKEKELKMKQAATIIQKYWRGYLTRKQYGKMIIKKQAGNFTQSLQEQVNNLEVAMSNLINLVVLQIDLPPPLNLRMTHFSSSCLLVQWDPPSDTPICTHPLINRPNISGYTLYLNGEKEGTVTPMKCKAYIEGLDCSITYRITVNAVYENGQESLPSNPVIAKLSVSAVSPDHSSGIIIGRMVEFPEFPKTTYNIRRFSDNDDQLGNDEGNAATFSEQEQQEPKHETEDHVIASNEPASIDDQKINTTYELNNEVVESVIVPPSDVSIAPPPISSSSIRKTTKFFQDPTKCNTSLSQPFSSKSGFGCGIVSTQGVDQHLTSLYPSTHQPLEHAPVQGNITMTTSSPHDGASGAVIPRLTSHSSLPSLVSNCNERSTTNIKRRSCTELYKKSFYKSVSSSKDLVMNSGVADDEQSSLYKKSFYNSLEYQSLI